MKVKYKQTRMAMKVKAKYEHLKKKAINIRVVQTIYWNIFKSFTRHHAQKSPAHSMNFEEQKNVNSYWFRVLISHIYRKHLPSLHGKRLKWGQSASKILYCESFVRNRPESIDKGTGIFNPNINICKNI